MPPLSYRLLFQDGRSLLPQTEVGWWAEVVVVVVEVFIIHT